MDEFDMLYDDWMSCKIKKIERNFTAKEFVALAEIKYPKDQSKEIDEKFDFLYEKALAAHQKIAMMMYAKSKFLEIQEDFESTQNMDILALYGMGKTELLFYLESMIIFARNALDIVAYIYSDLFFDQRMDSFNKFVKKIKKSESSVLAELKQFYNELEEDEMSALKVLCGTEKGRALRDIIIHQANVRIGYYEYKKDSEKERLFLEVKDKKLIDIDFFIFYFTQEVIDIMELTNKCCKKQLQLTR